MTIQTVKDAFSNLKKDISDVSNTLFIQWCDYANNELYRLLIGVDPERVITTNTINVTSGTASYALPSGFRDMDTFGTGIFQTDASGNITDTRLVLTGPGSQTRGYYLNGSNIILTPAPTKNETLIQRYVPALTTLASLSDSFISALPTEYLYQLVNAIDVLYSQWDEDPSMESLAGQRYSQAITTIAQSIAQQPRVYGTSDLSQAY